MGHGHGCSGVVGGCLWLPWQAVCSMSALNPGHHTGVRANPFILTMPGWLLCSSVSTCGRIFWGTTTLVPQNKHLASTLSSAIIRLHANQWKPLLASPVDCSVGLHSTVDPSLWCLLIAWLTRVRLRFGANWRQQFQLKSHLPPRPGQTGKTISITVLY